MDLHGIVTPIISSVNPQIPAVLRVSTGSVRATDGSRTPAYAPDAAIFVQVQSLTYKDIQQIDGLNLQGTRRAIYAHGQIDGLVRSTNKGGDLIIISGGVNNGTWLVAMVLEQWPDWCKVAVTLQNNG